MFGSPEIVYDFSKSYDGASHANPTFDSRFDITEAMIRHRSHEHKLASSIDPNRISLCSWNGGAYLGVLRLAMVFYTAGWALLCPDLKGPSKGLERPL